MKRYYFCLLCLIVLSCNQNDKGGSTIPEEAPKEFVKNVEGVEFKMIRVEKVKKTMLGKGSNKERIVSLSPYYIAETEVTQELYKAVTGESPSRFNDATEITEGEIQAKRPVESINWYDAALFCNKLTEKLLSASECVYTFEKIEKENGKIVKANVKWDFSKKGYRLPTEAEFEYAARGGDADLVFAGGDFHITDDSADGVVALEALSKVAWFDNNSGNKTHQVAKKDPNGYGIYDMSGNVMEWCNDYYIRPIPENSERDPQGPDEDTGFNTCKGGSYGPGGYSMCTVTSRNGNSSQACLDDIGLRVVCRLYK